MNLVDFIIIFIMAVSSIVGVYNGFVLSALNAASFILSWLCALIFYPLFTKILLAMFPNILKTITYYAEGSSKILNIEDKTANIALFTKNQLTNMISNMKLPNPFNNVLISDVFNSSKSIQTLGEYFDSTIANVIINILSFLLLFMLLKFLLTIVLSIARAIVKLPILKQFDTTFGAGFGILRGFFIVCFLFALIPILMTLAPVDLITEYLDGSLLAGFFVKANIFTNFISGKI